MKLMRRFTVVVMFLSLAAGGAFAQDDKAKKQAEVRKAAQTSLDKFYKADPKLKGEVGKAVGYGVFTTYGLSFFIGGAGGHGLVHDKAKKKDTFMSMAKATAGPHIGATETETLIIFKSAKAMNEFVEKGWEFGGSGGAGGGAGGKSAGMVSGESLIVDALYYTLTKNGLQFGGAFEGTKFWKDKELN
jgi:lipid-binding SYLF domain-containing protein